MPTPAYVLREASVYLDEVAHLVSTLLEDYDPWTPLEESMQTLRWLLNQEVEEAERPGPADLQPI